MKRKKRVKPESEEEKKVCRFSHAQWEEKEKAPCGGWEENEQWESEEKEKVDGKVDGRWTACGGKHSDGKKDARCCKEREREKERRRRTDTELRRGCTVLQRWEE